MNINKILVLLGLVVIGSSSIEYNQTLAQELWRLSGLSYCDENTLSNWNCGYACNLYKNQIDFIYFYFNDSIADGTSYSMFYDKVNNLFIISFRGSNGTEQLIDQIALAGPVKYDLFPIEGAYVTSYFYEIYLNTVRDNFLDKFEQAVANYSDAQFVFTGNSLGATLASHAILDVILSGLINPEQTMMYNYGSPRVGNYDWANFFVKVVPNAFRLVHYKDIFPHLPNCWPDLKLQCTPGKDDIADGGEKVITRLWHAWHIWENIWYDQNCSEYTVCNGGEDPNCADKFDILETNLKDHLNFFGIPHGCNQDSSEKLIDKLLHNSI